MERKLGSPVVDPNDFEPVMGLYARNCLTRNKVQMRITANPEFED